MDTSARLRPQEPRTLPKREDSSSPPISHFPLINPALKQEKPTTAVMNLIKKAMEVMKLDHQIRETQIQQEGVMEKAGLLLNEKLLFQANPKVTIANLTNDAKKYRREIKNQWDKYAQESGEMLPMDMNQPQNMQNKIQSFKQHSSWRKKNWSPISSRSRRQ